MLDRAQIAAALGRLAAILRERGAEGELCLLDGTVMVVAFKARATTKDVGPSFIPAG
jgi:hypothetical protein